MVAPSVLAEPGEAEAAAPFPAIFAPRAAGVITLGVVTGLDFASDGSAQQAGAAPKAGLGLDVGVMAADAVELALSYRHLLASESDDALVSTFGHRVALGALFHVGLGRAGSFFGGVGLEATQLTLAVDLPENDGAAGAWAYGVVPSLGFQGLFPVSDDLALGFRASLGWGFRTAHAYHAVELAAEGDDVRPLDLGDLNLSGLEAALGLRLAFR